MKNTLVPWVDDDGSATPIGLAYLRTAELEGNPRHTVIVQFATHLARSRSVLGREPEARKRLAHTGQAGTNPDTSPCPKPGRGDTHLLHKAAVASVGPPIRIVPID